MASHLRFLFLEFYPRDAGGVSPFLATPLHPRLFRFSSSQRLGYIPWESITCILFMMEERRFPLDDYRNFAARCWDFEPTIRKNFMVVSFLFQRFLYNYFNCVIPFLNSISSNMSRNLRNRRSLYSQVYFLSKTLKKNYSLLIHISLNSTNNKYTLLVYKYIKLLKKL